ncbi:hypothetical protein HPB48_027076 [Haemaphysalis longicornis]|uniref:Uncharacterized protein n=1 Tax=Haemaphysalis longicornis TaxID=44386 RepID=A0A9J6HDW6_HAELO|nr:hypothetical protein HPB48_027076 [Haemaphysalis longicornis]
MRRSSLECSRPNGVAGANSVNNGPTHSHRFRTVPSVWPSNLDQEFGTIACSFQTRSYFGMDTGFPGVLVRLNHQEKKPFSVLNALDDAQLGPSTYQCALVQENVNILNIITQVGLTFPEENGNPAPNCPPGSLTSSSITRASVWVRDSIRLLLKSGVHCSAVHCLRCHHRQRQVAHLSC